MFKKLTVSFLLLISISIQASFGMEDHWQERARPVNVLSVPFFTPPDICLASDFVTTCPVQDQACKTRKEKCGDAAGALLNNDLLSVEHGFSNMTLHNGKYDKIHGIDDYRTAQKRENVLHHFTENKAHTSQLGRATNQASNHWHREKLKSAYKAGNLTRAQYKEAVKALEQGKATRAVAHTTLVKDEQGSQHFQTAFKPILSRNTERRKAELHTYCETIHPSVLQLSQQYYSFQTHEQRLNLIGLSRECEQASFPVPSPISHSYNHSDALHGVCYVRNYDRENLYKFLTFLKTRGYTNDSIARGSPLSTSTIGNLIRDRNHAPSSNYQDLWNYLETNFAEEFGFWTTIP